MKSEIIYDGGVLEKRDRMLQNLATIISVKLYNTIFARMLKL